MLPLILYSDDTSGNKSKKWHKFDSWCVLLAGLPREANTQIPNIHFVCCSDSLSFLEMAESIAQELTQLEIHGLEVYDAHLRQPVLVVAPVLCAICDNPRASEMLNHRRNCSEILQDVHSKSECGRTHYAESRFCDSTLKNCSLGIFTTIS